MTIPDYKPFIDRVINRYEGGYGWNHNDSGGPTKFGITCFDLAEFEGKPMDSMAAWAPIVEAMPLSTAEIIYQTKYATATDFNTMNVGKDCVTCDYGINSGPAQSIRTAQRIVGTTQDGVLGPVTFAAVQAYDPIQFIDNMCDERLAFLEGLPTWGEFRPGWSARVADLRMYCKGLLTPAALSHPMALAPIPRHGKGYPTHLTQAV